MIAKHTWMAKADFGSMLELAVAYALSWFFDWGLGLGFAIGWLAFSGFVHTYVATQLEANLFRRGKP